MKRLEASKSEILPKQPESYLLHIILIASAALVIGTIVPALVAYHTKVFYASQLIKTIKANTSARLDPMKRALETEEYYQWQIKQINDELGRTISDSSKLANVPYLLSLRADLQSKLDDQKHRFVVSPLFLGDLMFAWSGMYISVATLAFVLKPNPKHNNPQQSKELALALFLVYLMYQGPVWLRNFVLTSEERKVFSFPNFEISMPSFFMQEINTAIWFILLFFVWRKWSAFYAERRCDLQAASAEHIDMRTVGILTDTFVQWQVSSVMLALGFILFTGVFWDLVIVEQDRRYLLPAVTMHGLWAISWWLISLPMLATWQDFSRKKTEVGLTRVSDNRSEHTEDNKDAVLNLSPISFWNGLGSVLTGIISFALPIVHAFLK